MLLDQGIVYTITVCVLKCSSGLHTSLQLYAPLIDQSILFHRASSVAWAYLSHAFPVFLKELDHQFHEI